MYEYGIFGWIKAYREAHRVNKDAGPPATFEEFLHFFNGPFLQMLCFNQFGIHLRSSIGVLTFHHVLSFHKNPVKVLSKDDAALESYFRSGEYEKDMYLATFLKTENLNSDLYAFLVRKTELGDDVLSWLLSYERQNISYKKPHLSTENTAYIKQIDRFYYRYFMPPSGRALDS